MKSEQDLVWTSDHTNLIDTSPEKDVKDKDGKKKAEKYVPVMYLILRVAGDFIPDAVEKSHSENRSRNRTKEHTEGEEKIHSCRRKEKTRREKKRG